MRNNNDKSKSGETRENIVQTKAFRHVDLLLGVLTEDAIAALRTMPDNCFNVVITSPPYFWVRDYRVEGQIGHEDTVEEYISRLADVFDEVKRVLHEEGVFYLNIGDTYYSGNGQPHGSDPRSASRNFMRTKMRAVDKSGWSIPKKSQIGIPWQLAFELQRRGWTLRSDIIWRRHNAFSEPSVRDRPKREHEHLFLFAKSRFYSYDLAALDGAGDVWEIPIERAKIMDHNAPFPTKLVEKCIATGSPPGGRVLDPFVGSGTTMLTSLGMGRHCVGIDLKDEYTKQLSETLTETGAFETKWEAMQQLLEAPCCELESWRGHLRNMRKPGRKPFTKKTETE